MTLKWQHGTTTITLDDPAHGLALNLGDSEGLFGFPPVRLEASDLDTGGAYIRDIVARGRRVLLNIAALDSTARDRLLALLPLGSSGKLIAEAAETRTLDVKVADVRVQWERWGWRILAAFIAEWPWWAGAMQVKTFARDAVPLFFPVPPVRVTSGAVYSEETIKVGGQAPTWPLFSVTGPCDYVVFENITTGLVLKLAQPLLPGETRIVNTRPPATVTDGTGANRMGEVDGYFWPLQPGQNTVRILAPNATDETAVTMTWYPAYAEAW